MLVERRRADGYLDVELVFHDENGEPLDDPELFTKQCFKDECDINNVVNRFVKAGVLPPPPVNGYYGDFSDVGSFQEALIKVNEANEMFNSLPAKLRARFDNDTGKFLDFVDDPANHKELVELGLVEGDSESVAPAAEAPVPSEQ